MHADASTATTATQGGFRRNSFASCPSTATAVDGGHDESSLFRPDPDVDLASDRHQPLPAGLPTSLPPTTTTAGAQGRGRSLSTASRRSQRSGSVVGFTLPDHRSGSGDLDQTHAAANVAGVARRRRLSSVFTSSAPPLSPSGVEHRYPPSAAPTAARNVGTSHEEDNNNAHLRMSESDGLDLTINCGDDDDDDDAANGRYRRRGSSSARRRSSTISLFDAEEAKARVGAAVRSGRTGSIIGIGVVRSSFRRRGSHEQDDDDENLVDLIALPYTPIHRSSASQLQRNPQHQQQHSHSFRPPAAMSGTSPMAHSLFSNGTGAGNSAAYAPGLLSNASGLTACSLQSPPPSSSALNATTPSNRMEHSIHGGGGGLLPLPSPMSPSFSRRLSRRLSTSASDAPPFTPLSPVGFLGAGASGSVRTGYVTPRTPSLNLPPTVFPTEDTQSADAFDTSGSPSGLGPPTSSPTRVSPDATPAAIKIIRETSEDKAASAQCELAFAKRMATYLRERAVRRRLVDGIPEVRDEDEADDDDEALDDLAYLVRLFQVHRDPDEQETSIAMELLPGTTVRDLPEMVRIRDEAQQRCSIANENDDSDGAREDDEAECRSSGAAGPHTATTATISTTATPLMRSTTLVNEPDEDDDGASPHGPPISPATSARLPAEHLAGPALAVVRSISVSTATTTTDITTTTAGTTSSSGSGSSNNDSSRTEEEDEVSPTTGMMAMEPGRIRRRRRGSSVTMPAAAASAASCELTPRTAAHKLVAAAVVADVCGDSAVDETLQHVAFGTLRGLRVLHEGLRVVHRDVKPANLLLDHRGAVKVADFGVACVIPEGADVRTGATGQAGSLAYMSPERVCGEPNGSPGDIWALGVTLLELAGGQHPYVTRGPGAGVGGSASRFWSVATALGALEGPAEREAKVDAIVSAHMDAHVRGLARRAGFEAFVRRCLAGDPKDRPSATELLRDPWLGTEA